MHVVVTLICQMRLSEVDLVYGNDTSAAMLAGVTLKLALTAMCTS